MTTSRATLGGQSGDRAGTTSSSCPTPSCPTTSPCRSARAGRSSTAPSSPSLVHKLDHILIRQEIDRPLLTQDGIRQLTTALSGRGLPQRDVVARALANEDAADALTEHQAVILDAIRLIHRVEVRGGAGSGKTFLAMEQARRLSLRGQRVALVCYSHGLASYLERISAAWPRRQRPAYVGEFHALGVLWGAPEGPDESLRTDETVQFWEHDLPLQMARLAAQLEPGHRFDSIVVDEAQDFADAWWDPLLAALKDDEAGGLYVFTDEGQRVFNRHGSPPVPLVPLILDHNVRNTRADRQRLSAARRPPDALLSAAKGPP